MLRDDEQQITLATLGGGAAEEMFGEALQKVLANIDDPNMDPKSKRRITLTLVFHPSDMRDMAELEVEVDTKLAGRRGHTTRAFFGKSAESGRYEAAESNPKQTKLQFTEEGRMPVVVNDLPPGTRSQ